MRRNGGLHRGLHVAEVFVVVRRSGRHLGHFLALFVPSLVARKSIHPVAKEIVSWNRRSRWLAHFRGYMVRHRLARSITQIALRIAVKHHNNASRPPSEEDETAADAEGYGFGASGGAEFAEDGSNVEFCGVIGDIEAGGDFFIA